MGRPRRDSNKSDTGSTAGNVYNASLAAAQQKQATEIGASASSSGIVSPNPAVINTSTPTPQLDLISYVATEVAQEKVKPIIPGIDYGGTSVNSIASLISANTNTSAHSTRTPSVTPSIHKRSLSIAELISLVSAKNNLQGAHSASSSTSVSALNALNLPEALRNTLEKADSPILNALLPLIRQKLADKTASKRRNSAVDLSNNNDSSTSLDSRRSSTSSRSEDHRLSHKLAERKRRKEMKDVFGDLKDVLPPGVPKSSKWEILNEASVTIDDLLAHEQALLNQRNLLLKRINDSQQGNI